MATARVEDRTGYYYNDGERVPLTSDPVVFAVCFAPGQKSDDATLTVPARRFLNEAADPIGFVPQYGLQIYRAAAALAPDGLAAAGIERAVRALEDEQPVKFAAQAVRRMDGEGNLSFLTPRFVVAFKAGVTRGQIDDLNGRYDVRVVERLGYVANGFLLEAPSAQGEVGPVALANGYYETGLCDFAHPDFIERRQWRNAVGLMDAPVAERVAVAERDGDYVSRQWHLTVAKVTDAWAVSRGAGVTVAVLDDGVDVAHPEFSGKLGPQFDFQNKVADASPKLADDKHGTACAGVAAAAGVKASGTAPDCQLIAVRTPSLLGVADEANMFRWASDQGADVITCSWGPPDNAGPFSLVDNVRAAINYCLTSGRGGKGIPVFFAAGNGNELVSDDGYASNPDVMAIAATSERDTRSPYSDFGPEIFICAPSSGDAAAGDRRVFTTDRLGAAGYNGGDATIGDAAGDYTARFGGTSSATPLVAGVAALVMAVDPTLTRDQVKEILKSTADKIGGAGIYDAQGHHPQFGFGRVNAYAAVCRAQTGGGSGSATTSSISAPASAAADAPPSFVVTKGNRRYYAVELATRRELFDGANAGQRSASSYYESWSTGLTSDATWSPPADVWSMLAAAGQVFYRAHFADDQNWTNYVVSASATDAPSIAIGGAGGGTSANTSAPSLSAPASSAADSPPAFSASFGGRSLFAVELGASADLMDSANEARRTSANYYGSWVEGLISDATYTPPSDVWASIAAGGRVFYRGHFASDDQWGNYATFPDSGPCPSIQVTGTGGGGGGSGEEPADTELTYPSGAVFRTVASTQDGIDYSDPVANGIIPLIEVRGREAEQLSASFRVRELMASGARYARIAPELVEALQALRSRIGKPLVIESGYRYPALNDTLGGDEQSEHLTGRAAVVRAGGAGASPTDIAQAALEAIEQDIGIGLGPSSVHIDVAGSFSTWVYEGAAMSDDQFASWARGLRANRSDRSDEPLREVASRGRPTIDGPELRARSDPPPEFLVNPGVNRYFAVEVATDWRLFENESRGDRTAETFYASWSDPRFGLIEAAAGQGTVFALPTEAWRRLSRGPALYYRVLTVSERSPDWRGLAFSIADDRAAEAPRTRLVDRRQSLDDALPTGLAQVLGSHALDESLWDLKG